jgi:hypothetical protein
VWSVDDPAAGDRATDMPGHVTLLVGGRESRKTGTGSNGGVGLSEGMGGMV